VNEHSNNFARDFLSKTIRAILHTPFGIGLLGISRIFYPQKSGNWLDINSIRLELPRLSPEFEGFRIVQISDIHIGTWITKKQLAEAVNIANQLQPDVVVLTGDFVTFEPERFANDLISELSRFSPKIATLAILGNHDHWADASILRRIFSDAGIIDLSNSVYTLQRGSNCLHIAGVDDYMVGKARLKKVLQELPAHGAAILLAHEPDFADISAQTGRFDLQLSGHAHGGQVNLPWIGPPFLPGFGRKYYSGLYKIDGMYQYTNRGLGTAELQIRINCRPEITNIELCAVKNVTISDSF
jgi:predicted MPP superfamily phosphohydrolase